MYDNHTGATVSGTTDSCATGSASADLGATGSASADLGATGSASASVRRRRKHWQSQWHTRAVVALLACALTFGAGSFSSVAAQLYSSPSLVIKVSSGNSKLELTTNTSRILTIDKDIPRVQVNNPELLAVTPLSATQVQISAKNPGVTQVNLWDEEGNIHTIDVLIYGDVAELEIALKTQFPNSSIRVYKYSHALVLKGFVDQPEHVSQIAQLASDYAPKVINNIRVGGVQQVLLKVKIMEVSRTKLRRLGVDWAHISGSGVITASSVSGLIAQVAHAASSAGVVTPDVEGFGLIDNLGTFQFGIIDGRDSFFGFIDALQQSRVAKILAEPNIVAVSGRPAKFTSGGEVAFLLPRGDFGTTVAFKEFGTIIDFLPIVLGNGNIRLEVRSEVSTRDFTLGTTQQGFDVPGFRKRYVETAVEMKAGQTFALAGLVEERVDTVNRGIPFLSDLPIIGVPFRRMEDVVDEIELLIMVTPEFVDAIEPEEVPSGGPGLATVSPNNSDLYWAGHIEVSPHCNPTQGMQACDGYCGPGCTNAYRPVGSVITDGVTLPGGTGYDDSYAPMRMGPANMNAQVIQPDAIRLPPMESVEELPRLDPSARRASPTDDRRQALLQSSGPQVTVPRPYSPPRVPSYVRNATKPDNQDAPRDDANSENRAGGLIGPVGYDAQ